MLSPLLWTSAASAITIYPDNATSVEAGLDLIIKGTFDYCPWTQNVSGATPGVFQAPYYWWEAGVAWGLMIDWATYTNNHTYDHWTKEALVFQSGKYHNYMTENQTSVEGNDDQAFWGITAMNAAEKNFTLYGDGVPPWLYFAQATFNTMANRWDPDNCGGGLRWQIFRWNAGWDYKNMVANGALFHLAARLGRFTNNETYVDWAERVWQWAEKVKLIQAANPNATDPANRQLRVLDGAQIEDNCTQLANAEWTYDQGLMLSGCAYLYNYTGNSTWKDRADGLWSRATALFGTNNATWMPGNFIMYEPGCMLADESVVRCTNDQRCFKAIALSYFGNAIQVYDGLRSKMKDYITFSAQAAAWSCSGGSDGHTCGLSWLHQGWDGWYGLGEQLSALGAFNTLLSLNYTTGPYRASDLPEIYKPLNSSQAGNSSSSEGNGQVYGWGSTAGLENDSTTAGTLTITTKDKGGAGFLTGFVVLCIVGGSAWLLL